MKQWCGMLDGLAFLPLSDVGEGMRYLRTHMPQGDECDNLIDLIDYFDSTYVSGTMKRIKRPANSHRIQPIRIRRIAPLFPPSLWNVHDITLAGTDRTNNLCESWNNGFTHLVGHYHPSLWTLIQALQQDEALATTAIFQESRGQPPTKKTKRSTKDLQSRLRNMCAARNEGKKTVEETLQGVGHLIRFF